MPFRDDPWPLRDRPAPVRDLAGRDSGGRDAPRAAGGGPNASRPRHLVAATQAGSRGPRRLRLGRAARAVRGARPRLDGGAWSLTEPTEGPGWGVPGPSACCGTVAAMAHDHRARAAVDRRRLAAVLGITAGLLVVELAGTLLSGSLA